MNQKNRILLFAVMATVSSGAWAHYLFIMPARFHTAPGETLLIGVHNADSFPVSSSAAKLHDGLTFHAAGSAFPVALEREGTRLIGEVPVSSVGHIFASASTPVSVIELEQQEFTDYLREENLSHVIAWREQNGEADKPGRERYSKYAKAMLVSGAAPDSPFEALGLPIEFVPETSPYQLDAGDVMPVRVLLFGTPAENLAVTATWSGASGVEKRLIGHTDAQGRINVSLSATGSWRLHTVHMRRVAQEEIDWESHWAMFTFEVQ